VIGLFALTGCSTPESRIAHHPEVFASLSPNDQALVRAGRVGLGMDEATVKLALGDPTRIITVTKVSGLSKIWRYRATAYYDGPFLYPGPSWGWSPGTDWNGPPSSWSGYSVPDPLMYDYLDDFARPIRIYDRFRIGFTNGKVSAIQEESQ